MEVTTNVLTRYRAADSGGQRHLLVGICGRAGAGKSSLASKLSAELDAEGVPSRIYAGDWRFALDSAERKQWLQENWSAGISEYFYSINQFNWWNFEEIYADLARLTEGKAVELREAYDRNTGKKDLHVTIPPLERGVIILENAILGGAECLERLSLIVLINTPDGLSLERTMRKDGRRRNTTDVAIRYLMTTYSENVFFRMLDKFDSRTITSNDEGRLGGPFEIQDVSHLPVPVDVLKRIFQSTPDSDRSS